MFCEVEMCLFLYMKCSQKSVVILHDYYLFPLPSGIFRAGTLLRRPVPDYMSLLQIIMRDPGRWIVCVETMSVSFVCTEQRVLQSASVCPSMTWLRNNDLFLQTVISVCFFFFLCLH